MVLLGCKPAGRFTEQHDIYFGIGKDLRSLVPAIQGYWPEANKLHIDAWREVTAVDSFTVEVVPRPAASVPTERGETDTETAAGHRLFFVNLGGYKAGEFDEFHYKMIVAAPDMGVAIRSAKDTVFYRHTGFKGAESHVDDKYGVDVDDIYDIEDILPAADRSRYRLKLTASQGLPAPDPLQLGYFQFHKL